MAMNKYMEYGLHPKVGTKMWCPVCGSYFKATDDTRYIRHGMYVCGWKCFRDPSKEVKEEPTDDQLVEVKIKVAEVDTVNKNKTAIASNSNPKSANSASKKGGTGAKKTDNQEKYAKPVKVPMEKCELSSQKTPKKCDKVELF